MLSCPLCLKPHFEGVDVLRTALIAVATSQISCPVCSEVLLGLDKLTIHLFSHVTQITNKINEVFENIEMVKQNAVIVETINETISDNKMETIHKQNDLPKTLIKPIDDNKLIRCDICNFCFSDENILEMHQKLLHQTLSDKNTGIYSYHCHLCSKKFKMRGSLMVHLRVAHYGFSNDKNQDDSIKTNKGIAKILEGKSGESIDAKNGVKQFSCDVCSKMFTTKYFLKKHKRLHTGEMPYFCSLCNKSFTFQQSYHKHMLYHSSEKPHVCGECGRAFKELSTLHNHERIHSGERPFACETCGKCFRQRVSYLVHRRIHTGAMPYQCTACDKTFRYKVSQRSHKCPINPPGSVIRTSNPESPNNASTQETILPNDTVNVNGFTGNGMNTIVFNAQGEIIGQNFAFDGKNIITFNGNVSTEIEAMDVKKEHAKELFNVALNNNNSTDVPMSFSNETENPDFFTMVISPSLPDVQGLCLINSPEENKVEKNTLHTINEESLKELLYGQNNS